ncbi:Fmu (Sun) domain-containing protein [Ferruginibacter sp. SUN106]|uniref:Fmu (Sun) domain-containing protein n=1 Tax=Ferruginibacter sp. SUN106 TaxID=2978348 RepID=UPI003D36DE50
MRYQSYLNTSKKLLELYKGEEPFASYLKKFFAANKKYGSKDRKYIASLCYAYFRLGKAAATGSVEDNILTGLFLSETIYNEVIHFFKPEWDEWMGKPMEEKIALIKFSAKEIFPFKNELTAAVSHPEFCESFLQQPKLFLRVRPNKKNIVIQKLQKAKIPLALIDEDCIALSNATKLDEVIETDREAVIQDYNSQQVFNFLKGFATGKAPVTAWDCCAASGGKSILLFDTLKRNIELTVSDIRLSILLNLHQRFNKAGIKNYNYFLGDLNAPEFKFPALTAKGTQGVLPLYNYQMIVCDAPCTGSGTWSRTPENLFYFKPETIAEFAQRQKQIVTNVMPYLQNEGLFFYITCSVFKKENEDVAHFIKEKFNLQILHMELLKGYDIKADSMFVTVLKK